MQHFKRNTDSYEDFGDDLLGNISYFIVLFMLFSTFFEVHDSIGPFGSAEQSGLFKVLPTFEINKIFFSLFFYESMTMWTFLNF
jgi:hypothetical protein